MLACVRVGAGWLAGWLTIDRAAAAAHGLTGLSSAPLQPADEKKRAPMRAQRTLVPPRKRCRAWIEPGDARATRGREPPERREGVELRRCEHAPRKRRECGRRR